MVFHKLHKNAKMCNVTVEVELLFIILFIQKLFFKFYQRLVHFKTLLGYKKCTKPLVWCINFMDPLRKSINELRYTSKAGKTVAGYLENN